jgi:hypothetical protein
MARHFDPRAIERALVILKVAERHSGDELDAALKAPRRAIGYCLKEASAGAHTGRTLEAIDAARSIVRNRV